MAQGEQGGMSKDKSVIPYGYYCDGCPYWSLRADLPHQENGYCAFLGKSDWDMNEEAGMIQGQRFDGTPVDPVSAHDMNMSLLWDSVKECDEGTPKEEDG